MADFTYTDVLPIGADETPYRLLTTEGVSHRGGRRAHVPAGLPRGAAAAGLRGHPRHPAPAPPGPPGPAAPDPRRPAGQPERPLRRPGPAQERQHRGRRRAAHVPGHRHRDRHGQARPAGAHRGPRRGGTLPRHLRRLPDPEPALLPAGPPDHVGRAQHRHQPARPDRAVRRHRARPRAGLQVPRHGQGRGQRQQVVPVPGDQGPAEPRLDDEVPRREAAQPGHRRLPAVPPGRRHRRHQRRVRAQDGQVRLSEVPRLAAHGRQRRGSRLPRPGHGGRGPRPDPAVRDRRAVRRQVLLPRRPRRPSAPARGELPGRDRSLVLGRPAGPGQDHPRGGLPRAAGARPGAVPARDHRRAPRRRRGPDRPEPADGRRARAADRPCRSRPGSR